MSSYLENNFLSFFQVSKYLSAEERTTVLVAYDEGNNIREICAQRPPLEQIAVIYTLYHERDFFNNGISLSPFIESFPLDFRRNNPWFVYAILAIEKSGPLKLMDIVVDGERQSLSLELPNDASVFKLGAMISAMKRAMRNLFRCQYVSQRFLLKTVESDLYGMGLDWKAFLDMEFDEIEEMERILIFHIFSWILFAVFEHYQRCSIEFCEEHVSYWYNLALKFADDVDMDLFHLYSSNYMLRCLPNTRENFCKMEFQYYKFKMAAKNILVRAEEDDLIKQHASDALKAICLTLKNAGFFYQLCDADEARDLANLGKRVSTEIPLETNETDMWDELLEFIYAKEVEGHQKKRCENNCTLELMKELYEQRQWNKNLKKKYYEQRQWNKNFFKKMDSIKQELKEVRDEHKRECKDMKEAIDLFKEELTEVKKYLLSLSIKIAQEK